MKKEEQKIQVARTIFRELEGDATECVILHHFDLSGGGDIDFCAAPGDLNEFLAVLRRILQAEDWEVVQVLEHEQSAAYIVCRGCGKGGGFLFLDYCKDYRVRGHLVLGEDEILEGSRLLDWGGRGSREFVELAYRFAKAAAKKKDPDVVRGELKSLWENERKGFEDWLFEKWGMRMEGWSEESVSEGLKRLRGKLSRRKWSGAEIRLKFRRLLTPRGLWIEVNREELPGLKKELTPCFREVGGGEMSWRKVLGSMLVLEEKGQTPGWKKWVLKRLHCWQESASGDEVIQFLARRTERYQGWTRSDG